MNANVDDTDLEVKRPTVCAKHGSNFNLMARIINRFSVLESCKKQRQSKKRKAGQTVDVKSPGSMNFLNGVEVQNAKIKILKCVQEQSFKEERGLLSKVIKNQKTSSKNANVVKKASSIYKLDPVFNEGLIRVGGRLGEAPISKDARHPVILPKHHHVVTLITNHYHNLYGHSGLEYTLSLIQQKYWIINGRRTVRRILNQCVSCKKRQTPMAQQKMANLPEDRTTPSKPPFTYTGVDCFGPFEVRRGRTTAKRYGVLFTCLSIRAIHLELASSLDTGSFVNALRRFIARRGQPEMIRSDNGGNSVKGEKELHEAVKEWNQSQIHDFLSQKNIKWVFNPPTGSHHGGVWERCIRTTRKVIKPVTKEQALEDEGINTLMCEVEAIVNGRPITKLSDDPRDMEPLTPNHLLLLRAGPTLPPATLSKQDIYGRRWRQVQYLADVFWRRWIKEYLSSLQQRQKWNREKRNFVVGDIVLVLDDKTPRNSWPLGRILEVYTNSNDRLVRSVKLKTRASELRRPVNKIVLLEGADVADNDKRHCA